LEFQRLIAVLKLVLVRGSQSVFLELVVVQAAFAMLVERRATRTEMFGYFMTDVIGDGVGGRGELSCELASAWGNESSL
jgi:hypothetical protein